MSYEEGVDTFTLLHESVYAYSNPVSNYKELVEFETFFFKSLIFFNFPTYDLVGITYF